MSSSKAHTWHHGQDGIDRACTNRVCVDWAGMDRACMRPHHAGGRGAGGTLSRAWRCRAQACSSSPEALQRGKVWPEPIYGLNWSRLLVKVEGLSQSG